MRGAIKDVGRALGMTPVETQAISNMVQEDENKKEFVPDNIRQKYPKLFEYVDIVYGTITSLGRHAAGLVVAPYDVAPKFGTLSIASDDKPVSQINMKEIDSLNYVKLDILGLDCVGLIYKTCKSAGIPFLTPDNMDFNDKNVWKDIANDTTLIFQFESEFAGSYLRDILRESTINKIRERNPNFSYIDLMSMANGAIRPAGASYRNELSQGIYRDNGHEALNEFLAPTLGYLVYQEQIIEFLHKFCGFTMGEADVVRRCVDENTLITMADGKRKKIKDIMVGDKVLCLDGNKIKYNIVKKVFDNGVKDTLTVETVHKYNITMTAAHKVLTQRGWIQAGNLTTSDYVMVPKKALGVTDNLRSNQRLSQTDMFLIGMLLGDGCIGKDYLQFSNHEMTLINKFKECVNARLRNHNNCNFYISAQDGVDVEKIYHIRVLSKNYYLSIKNLLKKYGMDKYASEKHIPKELLIYPIGEKLLSLLGGLFSTDSGYINNARAISYYSISEELAYDVQYLLLRIGVYSYVSKHFVPEYNYYCYETRISQKDALNQFKIMVVPYIVGNKQQIFSDLINKNNAEDSFNYLLPLEYKKEILNNANYQNVSFNSINESVKNDCITDVKARRLIDKIYCPSTYKLLMSDYIPLKIQDIKQSGKRHVYDIEVNKNHNYIANGLIVHNCFAKKTGTEKHIPLIKDGGYLLDDKGNRVNDHYIHGFISTMKEKYNVPENRSEELIGNFLQVIIDASDYLFSKNHADPYSFLGFACGYLRHYYPLETLTEALNIYSDNKEKSNKIKDYISSKGYSIRPIRFGHSGSDYVCDKDTKSIYQGIGSIKYCNDQIAEELLELSKNKYNNFVELLNDIHNHTSVNSRQLTILIGLDFFSDFGQNKYLMEISDLYDKFAMVKQIKKDKMEELGLTEYLMQKYAEKETAKMYKDIDNVGLITELCERLENKSMSVVDQVKFEKEYLEYVVYINPKVHPSFYIVTDYKTYKETRKPYCVLHNIKTGEDVKARVTNVKVYEYNPFGEYSILRIDRFSLKHKKKCIDGKWQETDELENILDNYEVIR